jgi:hypothetical protein
MKCVTEKIISSGDMSGNIESQAILLDQIYGFSAQAIYTGSPDGVLSLLASNQDVKFGEPITEWTTITGSEEIVSAPGDTMWNFNGAFYRWFKVSYSFNSGSGSLDVTFTSKGV